MFWSKSCQCQIFADDVEIFKVGFRSNTSSLFLVGTQNELVVVYSYAHKRFSIDVALLSQFVKWSLLKTIGCLLSFRTIEVYIWLEESCLSERKNSVYFLHNQTMSNVKL